jgi:hypothetical protein
MVDAQWTKDTPTMYSASFDQDLAFEVIEYVDATYNTFGTREKRAVIGSSISAGGAARMGLKYYDTFAAATISVGYPDLGVLFTDSFRDEVLSENSGPPYDFTPPGCCAATYFSFQLASALSPNLSKPPYYVDFPFDTDGNFVESVKERWVSNHGSRFAKMLPPNTDVKIWIDYDLDDKSASSSSAFRDSLDALGIPYEYMIHTCGHRACANEQAVFDARSQFLADALALDATGIGIEEADRPNQFILHSNYPNPFNPTTRIDYELQWDGQVEFIVSDVLGRRIFTLSTGYQPAGVHSILWTAPADVPSGVYVYTIRSAFDSEMRPMVLLK